MKYQNAEGRMIEATEHAYEVCYRDMGFVPVEEKKSFKKKEEGKDESTGEDVEESEAASRAKRGRK